MTFAPISFASWVADSPTGPWPKIAIVSLPERFIRRRAPQAVPVPQEMAAPVSKERSSGSGTSVLAGTHKYLAWPPLALLPYTFTGCS